MKNKLLPYCTLFFCEDLSEPSCHAALGTYHDYVHAYSEFRRNFYLMDFEIIRNYDARVQWAFMEIVKRRLQKGKSFGVFSKFNLESVGLEEPTLKFIAEKSTKNSFGVYVFGDRSLSIPIKY